MIAKYFRFALRQIRKNKIYSFLNILGLSIGLSCSFVIYLFIQNELSYDQYHTNKDRIYRVIQTNEKDNGVDKLGGLTAALAPKAAENIARIEAYTRIGGFAKRASLTSNPDSLFSFPATSVDLGFTEIFDLEFLIGSKMTSFKSLNSVLLNRSKAEQMFGNVENALNQEFKIGSNVYKVDGVFQDLPETSSLKYSILLPFPTAESSRGNALTSWNMSYFDQTYFLLHEAANPIAVGIELDTLFKQNMSYSKKSTMSLESLNDMHFALEVRDRLSGKSDRQYITIFSGVAFFILICAVFNYISLTLSQSVQRTKEMGIRKVIGADRKQLFAQFIFESTFFVMLGTVVALFLMMLSLPVLEDLLGRDMAFSLVENPEFILMALFFSIILAFLSAIYPARIALKMQAADLLRGTGKQLFSPQRLVNAITVFQIVVFVALICSAFVARRQMQFMQNENLGFDNERMLVLRMSGKGISDKATVLKNELEKLSNVERISYASSIPTSWGSSQSFNGHDFTFFNFTVDENYLETMGMKLIAGRNLQATDTDSTFSVLINETAAQKLNIDDNPIGHVIKNGSRTLTVIGLVNDFHFISKKQPIEAVMFRKITPNSYGNLVLKLKSENLKGTVAEIEKAYEGVTDKSDPDYFFLDDQFNKQYEQENVMSTMINTFTLLAALVAFIGLFGISGYAASRRLKEMGIRKVLGANFVDIQKRLNYANLIKIVVAVAIAVPMVIYLMRQWLNSFAYRIDMPIWVITGAVIIATLIILFTVSIHSIKAYFLNPVDVLKDE